jgi:hypothetical protein
MNQKTVPVRYKAAATVLSVALGLGCGSPAQQAGPERSDQAQPTKPDHDTATTTQDVCGRVTLHAEYIDAGVLALRRYNLSGHEVPDGECVGAVDVTFDASGPATAPSPTASSPPFDGFRAASAARQDSGLYTYESLTRHPGSHLGDFD